jgi:peptidoglycan-N-acetylglucosamine deacetylase
VSAADRSVPPRRPASERKAGTLALVLVVVITLAALAGGAFSLTNDDDGAPAEAATDTAAGTSTTAPSTVPEPEPEPETTTTTEATTTTAPPETVPPETVPPEPRPVTPVVTVPPAIGAGPSWPGAWQVALTFDDGPDPTWTSAILEQLAAYGVPATFFVLGSASERWPELVQAMVAGGHRVQNHSWTHPDLTTLSNDGILGQLSGTADVIQSLVGYRPACWRPPYGAVDGRVEEMAASLGFNRVMWNVSPNDYLRPPPDVLADSVVARAAQLGGAGMVVVLHDGGGNRANTAAALPGMIEGLSAAGYSFVALC